jgi:hypothetical protein
MNLARHLEYRSCLIDHIISITLRHWDVAMRELGAQALRRICELDLKTLGLECASKMARTLSIQRKIFLILLLGGIFTLY